VTVVTTSVTSGDSIDGRRATAQHGSIRSTVGWIEAEWGESIVTLPREEVVPGLLDELTQFEKLIRSLDAAEWKRPSRCGDWTAGDVAGHVIGQLADVAAGRFDGLGTPEVTNRQVEERRGSTPAELADELAAATAVADVILATFDDAAWAGPGPAGGATLGDGVEALWFDASLHADDIRDAVGRSTDMSSGVKVAISHLAQVLTEQGHAPATLALDGLPEFLVAGGGAPITGEPVPFIMVATGRAEPEPLGLDETINVYR
jgi:uncharacterized protein (TIGR03083 family)